MGVTKQRYFFTLVSREECEGNAFGLLVCLFVCLSVREHSSKTPIYVILFLGKAYYTLGMVLHGERWSAISDCLVYIAEAIRPSYLKLKDRNSN